MDLTPLLRVYARYRLGTIDRLNPAAVQQRVLLDLIRTGADTRFGRDHGFRDIGSVQQFQDRVPLRTYDQMWEAYWQPAFPVLRDVSWPRTIPFFAVSSGTSKGGSKYIPWTQGMNRANTLAGLDVLCHHARQHPKSTVLGGRSLFLGGSTDLKEEAPGIFSGDVSGIAAKSLPGWARRFQFPPLDIALLSDWEEKIRQIAACAQTTDIRVIAGTPSWLLILFDEMARQRGVEQASARDLFPNLQLLIHGGVNFAPYRSRFEAFLAGTQAELREVYPASEGFIAVADRGPGEGLCLILDTSLFFEFVPLSELDSKRPTRHWVANAEVGQDYALVLSNRAGLFAYVIGDTVRIVSRTPPRVLITGRISYMMSAFGEHLIGEEIEDGVATAAAAIDARVTDFSMGALFPEQEGGFSGHLFIIEFDQPIADAERLARFADLLDQRLCQRNDDFRAHRSYGMNRSEIKAVPPGTFAAWMKSRGRLGGQNKVPRVINDQELFKGLRRFVGEQENASGGQRG